MSWQICGECRGCPASSYHKIKCMRRNKEYEDKTYINNLNEMYERWYQEKFKET